LIPCSGTRGFRALEIVFSAFVAKNLRNISGENLKFGARTAYDRFRPFADNPETPSIFLKLPKIK